MLLYVQIVEEVQYGKWVGFSKNGSIILNLFIFSWVIVINNYSVV